MKRETYRQIPYYGHSSFLYPSLYWGRGSIRQYYPYEYPYVNPWYPYTSCEHWCMANHGNNYNECLNQVCYPDPSF
nr:hypothetical protein [Neobacillus sp. Marseille-Q6967]